MYGLGRILGFFIFLGSILLGGFFADDLNLGSDVGFGLGCLVGAAIWFGIMQTVRSTRGMGRASKEEIAKARAELLLTEQQDEDARVQIQKRVEDNKRAGIIDTDYQKIREASQYIISKLEHKSLTEGLTSAEKSQLRAIKEREERLGYISTEIVTKECPFCAETIKAKAIVCRYCGRDLPEG